MRHSLRLFNYYKSYENFFKTCNINIDEETIQKYYDEFCTSKSLRVYSKDSEKYFEYLINRLHLLGDLYQYDYNVPLVYKGYKCTYEHDIKLDMYVGYVENEFDSSVSGKSLRELEEDFQNTVDFVILMR